MATPLSKFLTLEEFCTCTDTYKMFKDEVSPYPQTKETLEALRDLSSKIIDPVIARYGVARFSLVYGFCSNDLRKRLQRKNPTTGKPYGRVAPGADQHMAHEVKASGEPFCARVGAACDFKIQGENTRNVIKWMIESRFPFDRIYYYGPDRAVHVSYGPEHSRYLCAFNSANVPEQKSVKDLIELIKARYKE